jgi:hypothetical protein
VSHDETSFGTGLFCVGFSPIQKAVEVMCSFHGESVRSTEAIGVGAMRVLGAEGRAALGMMTRGVELVCCAKTGHAKPRQYAIAKSARQG